jgi:hypothetical protein
MKLFFTHVEMDHPEQQKTKLPEDGETRDNLLEKYRLEMRKLCNQLRSTERSVAGCGARAQGYIDSDYSKIERFLREHGEEFPELMKMKPPKPQTYNDGSDGFATGLLMMYPRFF